MSKLCKISCKFEPKSIKNGVTQSCFRFFAVSSSLSSSHHRSEEENYPTIRRNRRTQRHYLSKLLFTLSATHYKEIHTQVILCGFESNPFLNNILIQSYSIRGCLDYARKVFDKMPKRDMISWSSVITMYTQNGFYDESLLLFAELRRSCKEGEGPNEFVLASVVSCCGRLGSIVKGEQLHCFVVKAGFDQFVYVGTSLIDFYSKGGDVGAARQIFDDLLVKSTATWTAIIAACVNVGKSEISLQLLRNMLETDVVPDNYVVSSILGACSSLEYIKGGKEIHGYVLRRGAEMDVTVSNVLIDFYMKCGKVKTARSVFDRMEVKNTISWTTMISGYMQNSSDWEAISMFRDLNSLGWMLDRFACSSVLISCGSVEALELGRQVHAYTVKANVDSDDFVKNSLIDMYAKCNSFGDARKVFDIMGDHDVISYNAIIEGCLTQNRLYEAFDLFAEMRDNLILPSLLTFVSLLGASASLFSLELSKQLHGLTIKFGFSADMFVCSILIDIYSKSSSIEDARQVFIEMNEKDIVVWNSMLFGYIQQCENEEALKLFLQLRQSLQKPNALTFVALIAASSNLVSLLHGLQFHNQIVKLGLDFDPHVTNALVDMYSKCGSLEEAHKMFNSTIQRDIACWNSMISTYAQHGKAKEALNMFEKMINDGLKPNNVTFVGVLSACSHVGLVKEGLRHFYSMSGFGIEPETEHYVCIVSLLGRAGKLVEATEFIETMPIPPATIVWRSLLSACREAGHIDLGKYAASMAISIDPKDSGSYILLSNIYASKGMWINVKKLREKMDSNGVVKEKGCSWIEINNEVHLFIARDRSHHQTDLIYSFLELLIRNIKGIGYVPEDTTFSNE
ncbi:pentatricopeptide repeat-containing protein At4g39530 [Solanum stenotomum]|uniref:pentatricopeptide repeat-containing protein At4g39530 n=1 Tax=Solanum stenotomum TaxID=172797 RepID=UPI0020D10C20|nr:pentatricopeptide repeat-containing protein At4g39530 [Solanum stenotomum]XP_049413322.1 pentatricopeptide repeat-containing protein At4g39530 [Solanum stenotomum]